MKHLEVGAIVALVSALVLAVLAVAWAFFNWLLGPTAATGAITVVVIVAPTHELAIQIHRQSCELALNAARAIRSVLLIGGTSTDRQIDKLKVLSVAPKSGAPNSFRAA